MVENILKRMIRNAILCVLPPKLCVKLYEIRSYFKTHYLIRNFLKNFGSYENENDLTDAVEYLQRHQTYTQLPGSYSVKYQNLLPVVKNDGDGFLYIEDIFDIGSVMCGEGGNTTQLKRLYGPQYANPYYCIFGYRELLNEQDPKSPHCYFGGKFSAGLMDDEIFIDVGAAEAMTSLSVIDKAKKIYIFESDVKWIGALEKTFLPWKQKVKIVHKYVCDADDDEHVSLDTFCEEEGIIREKLFIKIDVEGAEKEVIKGVAEIIEHGNVRMALCTYHNSEDAELFYKFFTEKQYNAEFSDNYILTTLNTADADVPELRKGVLRIDK